jgi:hypothetical protein
MKQWDKYLFATEKNNSFSVVGWHGKQQNSKIEYD